MTHSKIKVKRYDHGVIIAEAKFPVTVYGGKCHLRIGLTLCDNGTELLWSKPTRRTDEYDDGTLHVATLGELIQARDDLYFAITEFKTAQKEVH